jgi:hypothetical protein
MAIVDAFSIAPSLSRRGSSFFSMNSLRIRAPTALVLLLTLPFDALIWSSSASNSVVPIMRLTRYLYGILKAHHTLVTLERSQVAPFAICRVLRVLLFFLLATHCLACAFFYFCTRPGAEHYATAPWLATEVAGTSGGLSSEATRSSRYLRSMCTPSPFEPGAHGRASKLSPGSRPGGARLVSHDVHHRGTR